MSDIINYVLSINNQSILLSLDRWSLDKIEKPPGVCLFVCMKNTIIRLENYIGITQLTFGTTI